MVLGVNSIWGASTIPPSRKKICEKNGKCNQYDFLQVLPKSSLTTFKTIFETLSARGGLSRDHHWRGGKQEIYDFQGFWSISQRVFDISS